MNRPRRILILAPHPDDEVLGAGGLIYQAVKSGDEVAVGFMTCGDGFVQDAERYYLSFHVSGEEYLHLGYERQIEARQALSVLGLSAERLHFFGYPDGGLDQLYVTHWVGTPWTSPTTGYDHVPYLDPFDGPAPYLGSTVLNTVRRLIKEFRPTILVMPSEFDEHPDHWATNAFGTLALATLESEGVEWAKTVDRWGYLVHWRAWPLPMAYRPQQPFVPPKRLRDLDAGIWLEVALEPTAVYKKRESLMTYVSQVELIKPFMLAFSRQTEGFFRGITKSFPSVNAAVPEWPLGVGNQESMEILNSGTDLYRRGRRDEMIDRVQWFVSPSHQFLRVYFKRRLTGTNRCHITIHAAHDPVVVQHWTVAPDGTVEGHQGQLVSVQVGPKQLGVAWPLSLYNGATQVIAGVQVINPRGSSGRTPFRLFRLASPTRP